MLFLVGERPLHPALEEGFRRWLALNPSTEGPRRAEKGDTGFDYAEQVRAAGITTRAKYVAALADGSLPLWREFRQFQRESVFALVESLREQASSQWARPVALGVNAWNMTSAQLADSHLADYFSNEVGQDRAGGESPEFAYLIGTALDKPIFATGTGENWAKVDMDRAVWRVRGWLARAYAFGHYFMYAYKKWTFSEETGTKWYLTPLTTYQPITDLLHGHPELFNEHEALPSVAVVYDAARVEEGSTKAQSIVAQLLGAHIPVELLIVGNETVKASLSESEWSRFEKVILPEPLHPDASPAARAQIEAATARGLVHSWTSLEALTQDYSSPIELSGASRMWALPRVRSSGDSLVVHLLNQAYQEEEDAFAKAGPLVLTIDTAGVSQLGALTEAQLYRPGREPEKLAIERVRAEGTSDSAAPWMMRVNVPQLDEWALVQFR